MTRLLISATSIFFLFACNNSTKKENSRDNIIVHKTKPHIKDSICAQIWDTALAYSDAGEFSTSLRLLKKCNDIEPNNATILNALGVAYFATNDSTTALKYYFDAIAADSLTPEPYAAAGCLLEMQAKYVDAIRILKLGYSKSNLNQFTHYNICFNLAITYYALDSCDQTEKYLSIAKRHGFDDQTHFDKKLQQVDEEVSKYCDYQRTHSK
jgi:tetratricopeptide (TPR) repeat protein